MIAAAILRRFAPWLLAGLLVAGLVAALALTRGALARTKLEAERTAALNRAAVAERAAADADRLAKAADAYATRTAAVRPIILQSRDEVIRYAQTPAGAARCRDADRVRAVDQLDAALFTPAPAGVGDGALPADAATPSAGR